MRDYYLQTCQKTSGLQAISKTMNADGRAFVPTQEKKCYKWFDFNSNLTRDDVLAQYIRFASLTPSWRNLHHI